MLINPLQNKMLHSLLTQTGLMHMKAELVFSYSSRRTSSSKELTTMEAANLINYLKAQPTEAAQCQQMRRKIIAKAHKMRWETAEGKADMERIEHWCLKYGGFKKKLNDHTYKELVHLVTQFNAMYKKFLAKF
ncbi:hypothetical protein ABDK00_001560 [Niabella insulamsoli]|uniref:hypothetical protein n=1 Tax=Niabella insulamsoli TaxID=3144874 RepID=UPI0031FE4073